MTKRFGFDFNKGSSDSRFNRFAIAASRNCVAFTGETITSDVSDAAEVVAMMYLVRRFSDVIARIPPSDLHSQVYAGSWDKEIVYIVQQNGMCSM